MRHSSKVTLAAFVTTIAFVVPVGWHSPDADIQSDGPKIRPAQKTLRVGDATVTVDFDRQLMMAGKTVSAILVASADRAQDVTVEVIADEDMGYGGERVPNPPMQVGKRTVVLHAQPGGGPPVVASFKLGDPKRSKGETEWFDIRAMAANKKLREGDLAVATTSVVTWGGNTFGLSIEPPAQIPAEGPFTIAVRVKNTTAAPLDYIDVSVGQDMSLRGLDSGIYLSEHAPDYSVSRVEDTSEADNAAVPVGAEKLFIYTVTPDRPGIKHFSFIAYARAAGGAMDARTFDRPDPTDDAETAAPIASR